MEEIDTGSDDFGKLSKINSAQLVNSMLHNLWLDFFRHIREPDYNSANLDLDCIWTILGGEKESDDRKEAETNYKNVQGKILNLGEETIKTGFSKPTTKDIVRYANYKKILMEKALLLRRLQNQQGKGTAYGYGEDEEFE